MRRLPELPYSGAEPLLGWRTRSSSEVEARERVFLREIGGVALSDEGVLTSSDEDAEESD
jgi:hypothetical protein